MYRKKPVVIEAHQWFKNGDHPEDYTKDIVDCDENGETGYPAAFRKANNWEGDVVRYFRHPNVDGESLCSECGHRFNDHGWIDTLEGGHRVCPGDWIITGVKGERYPCKPDIFEQTYDPACGESKMTSITIEVPDGYTAVKDGDVIRVEKLPEPEPQEEWMPHEGELIEVSNSLTDRWRFRYFKRYSRYVKFPWKDTEGVGWVHARPLSNPMIVQFHPHDGGECPCSGQIVVCMFRKGEIYTGASDSFSWRHYDASSDIIGWAPMKEDK